MNYHPELFELSDAEQRLAYVTQDYIKIENYTGEYSYLPIADTLVSFITLDLTKLGTLLNEEFDNKYFSDLFTEFINNHPYLELFPMDTDTKDLDMYFKYYDYLSFLQTKFKALFDFCFNQDSFFEELLELTATQRLHVYTQINYSHIPQELKQVNALDSDVLIAFSNYKDVAQSPLEARLNIPGGFINFMKDQHVKMIPTYLLSSTLDALTLEFYLMIERNVKLKKCKHCGYYFEIKTKRNPDYCDKIFENRTQTCQQIMATKFFKEKTKDNEPYKIFNLYYKRYHERKKVGTIKADVFDKWNKQACTKRDECIDGKGDTTQFEQWCYQSFPNRKRTLK